MGVGVEKNRRVDRQLLESLSRRRAMFVDLFFYWLMFHASGLFFILLLIYHLV